jgi:hypothetical protein
MKKIFYLISSLLLISTACSDDLEVVIPYDPEINLNEITLAEDFIHVVPENGFSSQGINFHTVKGADGQLEAGFAYSNRSNRSFTWTGTEAALDSNRYSVFTLKPNRTYTYAIAKVKDDETYFTLDNPSVISHILVGNTTYTYLALTYGDVYGTAAAPVANPNIPNPTIRGVWYTYVPGGVTKFDKANKDYYRIIAKGYKSGTQTGSIKFDLACKGSNDEHPAWDYIVDDWYKFDLTALGTVDKVVFNVESSDIDQNGNIRTPAWFALDGILLKK